MLTEEKSLISSCTSLLLDCMIYVNYNSSQVCCLYCNEMAFVCVPQAMNLPRSPDVLGRAHSSSCDFQFL